MKNLAQDFGLRNWHSVDVWSMTTVKYRRDANTMLGTLNENGLSHFIRVGGNRAWPRMKLDNEIKEEVKSI